MDKTINLIRRFGNQYRVSPGCRFIELVSSAGEPDPARMYIPCNYGRIYADSDDSEYLIAEVFRLPSLKAGNLPSVMGPLGIKAGCRRYRFRVEDATIVFDLLLPRWNMWKSAARQLRDYRMRYRRKHKTAHAVAAGCPQFEALIVVCEDAFRTGQNPNTSRRKFMSRKNSPAQATPAHENKPRTIPVKTLDKFVRNFGAEAGLAYIRQGLTFQEALKASGRKPGVKGFVRFSGDDSKKKFPARNHKSPGRKTKATTQKEGISQGHPH